MCRKAGQNLSALLRFPPYFDSNKRKTIYPSMVKSQLNCCPLVCPRRSNSLIHKAQERALCIIYNDQLIDFKSFLTNYNEINIHQRNLQVLMTEIYEIINHIALPKCHLYLKYVKTFTTQDIFKSSIMKARGQ